MKHTTRLLALSALVLAVVMAAIGAPALNAPGVAFAQGQVPDAPVISAARSGDSTINLSWTAPPGAESYILYAYDSVNEWVRLDVGDDFPLTATSFSHEGLTADRLYYYQVRGVNSDGGQGAWSTRVNEVAGQNAPARPVLTATAGYLQNVVTWPAVSGATSYLVFAWDGSWDEGTPETGTTHTDTDLTAGRTIYYEARAVNANGVMSAFSRQVSAVVLSSPNISEPTLSAARGDQKVTLTWTASTAPAGQSIARYEYRHAASGETLPTTWVPVGNVLTTEVGSLTNGTTYNFEVQAVSNTGATGNPGTASATPSTVPNAPTLTATEGYRLVTLSWDAPANNGAAITRYHIEILNTQNNWVSETSVPGSATSYTDRSLSDSTVYTYRVIAENVAGRSSASNSADATTLAQTRAGAGHADCHRSILTARRGEAYVAGAPLQRRRAHYQLRIPLQVGHRHFIFDELQICHAGADGRRRASHAGHRVRLRDPCSELGGRGRCR